MLKKLDIYIIRKFLFTFFLAILLMLCISVTWDIAEKVEDFITSGVTARQVLAYYLFNFMPYFAVLLSPLFVFISVVYFTSRMAGRSEFPAILSSGVSFGRILRPYMCAAALIALLTLAGNHYLVPVANKGRISFENTYIRNPYMNTKNNIHLQSGKNTYVYVERFNNALNEGYKFSFEKIRDGMLWYKLRAERINWDSAGRQWIISNYFARTIDSHEEKISRGARKTMKPGFTPADFGRKSTLIEAMTTPELRNFIALEKMRSSEKTEQYLVHLYERTASPFSTFILTLIGISIASRKTRGGTGIHLSLGLAVGFSYIFVMRVSSIYSINAGLSPLVGAWLPSLLFGLLAVYLVRIAPK